MGASGKPTPMAWPMLVPTLRSSIPRVEPDATCACRGKERLCRWAPRRVARSKGFSLWAGLETVYNEKEQRKEQRKAHSRADPAHPCARLFGHLFLWRLELSRIWGLCPLHRAFVGQSPSFATLLHPPPRRTALFRGLLCHAGAEM